jgi:hypothetical protein
MNRVCWNIAKKKCRVQEGGEFKVKKQMLVILLVALLVLPLILPDPGMCKNEFCTPKITRIYFTTPGAIGPANLMNITGKCFSEHSRVLIDGKVVESEYDSYWGILQVELDLNYDPQPHKVQVMNSLNRQKSRAVRIRF